MENKSCSDCICYNRYQGKHCGYPFQTLKLPYNVCNHFQLNDPAITTEHQYWCAVFSEWFKEHTKYTPWLQPASDKQPPMDLSRARAMAIAYMNIQAFQHIRTDIVIAAQDAQTHIFTFDASDSLKVISDLEHMNQAMNSALTEMYNS